MRILRRPWGWLAAAGVAAVAAVFIWGIDGARDQERWALLETYCLDCHNSLDFAGDLSFEGLTPDSVPQHAEIFEAAIAKLRGRLMPPPGARQPAQQDIDALIAWLEGTIDEGAEYRKVGHVTAQRLNRTELSKAVKDLLGIDIDATEYLPAEIEVDGFTNIAAALSASPAFVEQYLEFASAAAHLAGVVAATTTLPVIGVPLAAGSPLDGIDALLSTVQMPGGVPVATVAIGKAGAKNAGYLAVRMMALKDPSLAEKLKSFVADMARAVEEKDRKLQEKL